MSALGSRGSRRQRAAGGRLLGLSHLALLCARHLKSQAPKPAPVRGEGLRFLMGGVSKNLGTSFKSQ